MIDDIDTSNPDLWKYVDDTAMAENVGKTKASTIQNDVDELVEKSKENRFQLTVAKRKELRISFAKHRVDLDPIIVNGKAINVAHTVKLLGLNISNDLRWNCHVSEISRKFAIRLYFLRQLERPNIPINQRLINTLHNLCQTSGGVCLPSFSQCAPGIPVPVIRETSETRNAHYFSICAL